MTYTARQYAKLWLGRSADFLFPAIRREMEESRNLAHFSKVKSAILFARQKKAKSHGDPTELARMLTWKWQTGWGTKFHQDYSDERLAMFVTRQSYLIHSFRDLIARKNLEINRLVEIGCGDGRALDWCVGQLPMIDHFVGIDLNVPIIAENRRRFGQDARRNFVAGDAVDWLIANPVPGTAILTNGGVLEYFSPESLKRLFACLASQAPAAAVLIESRSLDHDLMADPTSHVFGPEDTFSHNYAAQLAAVGFEVDDSKTTTEASWMHWSLILAHLSPTGPAHSSTETAR